MPQVTITGLVTTAGAPVATNPLINTDAPFVIVAVGAGAVPQTCSAIKSEASAAATSDAFLQTYKLSGQNQLDTQLTTLKAALALADQGQELTGKAGFEGAIVNNGMNIKDFVRSISTTYLPIIKLADTCLQESLQIDTSALTTAQAAVDESK